MTWPRGLLGALEEPCGRSEQAIHPGATQKGARLGHDHVMIGMINSATMLATLIIGLMAGPAVSL